MRSNWCPKASVIILSTLLTITSAVVNQKPDHNDKLPSRREIPIADSHNYIASNDLESDPRSSNFEATTPVFPLTAPADDFRDTLGSPVEKLQIQNKDSGGYSYDPPPSSGYGSPPRPLYGPPRPPPRPSLNFPPKPSYGPPPRPSYGPPSQFSPKPSYGPPPSQPKPSYGPPPTQPRPSYGPPPSQPRPNYGPPPRPSYGPPKPDFGYFNQPKPSYGPPPKPDHELSFPSFPSLPSFPSFPLSPKPEYGPPPKPEYGPPPKPEYGPPPKPEYGPPPRPEYGPPPKPEYDLPPKPEYGLPPKPEYGPPPRPEYGPPPKPEYGPPPKPEYGPPPKPEYGPPPRPEYGPPPKPEYGPPPKPEYGPPPRPEYGPPPKPEYGPPLKPEYGPPPKPEYGPPPKPEYGPPPRPEYGPPPKPVYGPPSRPEYSPSPKPVYGPPPKPEYGPPPSPDYGLPPKTSFGVPSPTPDFGNFNQPKPEYGPPKPSTSSYPSPGPSSSYLPPIGPSVSHSGSGYGTPGGVFPPSPPVVSYDGWRPMKGPEHPSSVESNSYKPNTLPHNSYNGAPPQQPLPNYDFVKPLSQFSGPNTPYNNGHQIGSTYGVPSQNNGPCDPTIDHFSQIQPSGPQIGDLTKYGVPYGGQSGRTVEGPNLNPKSPIPFRPPVPPGLLESNKYSSSQASNFIAQSYIPPAVPEISKSSQFDSVSQQHTNDITSFDAPARPSHDLEAPNLVEGIQYNSIASFDSPFNNNNDNNNHHHPSANIGPSAPEIPGPTSYSYSQSGSSQIPSDNYHGPSSPSNIIPNPTDSLPSITNNIDISNGYYSTPGQAFNIQPTSAGVDNRYHIPPVGQEEFQSVFKGLGVNEHSISPSQSLELPSGAVTGIQEYPIQGNNGQYTLQFQSADGGAGLPGIAHDQVLSNGLLQDILTAIEQPTPSAQQHQSGGIYKKSIDENMEALGSSHFGYGKEQNEFREDNRLQRNLSANSKESGQNSTSVTSTHILNSPSPFSHSTTPTTPQS